MPVIRVLMITSTWPQPGRPCTTHFIERQANFLPAAGVALDVYHIRGRRRPGVTCAPGSAFDTGCCGNGTTWSTRSSVRVGCLRSRTPLPGCHRRGSDLLGIVSDEDGRYTWSGRVGQWVSRLAARHADAVVVVAEHIKRHLPRSVSATLIPSGLDLSLFRPCRARQPGGVSDCRPTPRSCCSPAGPHKRASGTGSPGRDADPPAVGTGRADRGVGRAAHRSSALFERGRCTGVHVDTGSLTQRRQGGLGVQSSGGLRAGRGRRGATPGDCGL